MYMLPRFLFGDEVTALHVRGRCPTLMADSSHMSPSPTCTYPTPVLYTLIQWQWYCFWFISPSVQCKVAMSSYRRRNG